MNANVDATISKSKTANKFSKLLIVGERAYSNATPGDLPVALGQERISVIVARRPEEVVKHALALAGALHVCL